VTDYGWIGSAYRDAASTQSYGGRARIEGVERVDLTLFSDEGGDFTEVTRFNPDGTLAVLPDYRPAQTSYSSMEPGTIKAWHLHNLQDDLWFVPPHNRLIVGLLDVREQSETYQTAMRLTLGVGKPCLLLIPRGVAHGIANVNSHPGHVLYFANNAFDPEQPDEHRLPWDLLGADFWTVRPG
jgi:dTDP-4-dehydrorhamnose 3,5-epimerase